MWLKTPVFHICFILFVFYIGLLNGNNLTTTIPPSIPNPIATPENLQKASNLAEAVTKILEVLSADTPVTKDLKKLLEASKMIGLILYETFNGTNVQKMFVTDNLKLARKRLIMKMEYNSPDPSYYSFSYDFFHIKVFMDFITSSFVDLLENLDKENVENFKTSCHRRLEILERMQTNLTSIINETVIKENYSSGMYNVLFTSYHQSLKKVLAIYPLCEILQNGKPDAETTLARGTKIIQILQKIDQDFKNVNRERQNYYWDADRIENFTKNYTENEFVNEKIAKYVYDDLFEKYKRGDYNFYVTVDSHVGYNHYGTLIHCSTECKSVKHFMNKNVYILRNVKSEKGYHECGYLLSLQTTSEATNLCETFNSTNTLEVFGNQLIQKCKNIRGIAIVRDGYSYASMGDKSDKGFTEIYLKNKCFGDLHVVLANNPL